MEIPQTIYSSLVNSARADRQAAGQTDRYSLLNSKQNAQEFSYKQYKYK